MVDGDFCMQAYLHLKNRKRGDAFTSVTNMIAILRGEAHRNQI